jgi:hypothetical protein
MSEVKNQVREALEPFAKAAAVWRSAGEAALMMCGPNDVHDLGEEYSEAGWMASMPDIKLIHLVAAEDALAAISHLAPDVPSSEEIDAIRARHEADSGFESDGMDSAEWRAALTMLATRAHADRATLLRLLDAAREELREVREAAFDAGFMASGEGWNGEYPGDAPQTDYYKEERAKALSALTRAQGESS